MGVVARTTLIGMAIGTVLVGTFTTYIQATSPSSARYELVTLIMSTIVMTIIFGGLPGAAIGAGIGAIRRAARPKEQRPVRLPLPQQPYDMWSEQVERCAESTRRVAAAVQTVPKSAARDWLAKISDQLTRELDDVRGIAQLGRALGAVDRQHPVYQRLLKAAHDFRQFENEVGRVALQMFDHPELDEARTHLEVLERQLPQLS